METNVRKVDMLLSLIALTNCGLYFDRLFIFLLITSSFQEWAYTMARRPSSVCLSVCPSVCKLLRKSLLLAHKWPDRHQTCTRWTPGQHASRVCSRSRSRSKVTWYAHFLGLLEWATPSLTVWLLLLLLQDLLEDWTVLLWWSAWILYCYMWQHCLTIFKALYCMSSRNTILIL